MWIFEDEIVFDLQDLQQENQKKILNINQISFKPEQHQLYINMLLYGNICTESVNCTSL